MDTDIYILALSSFFIASFLKGLTGIGFSTLCLAVLASFLDMKLAITLVFLPSLFSNLIVMKQTGRFVEALKRFWLLYLSALPGLGLGIWFLSSRSNEFSKALLGLSMLIYGLWALRNRLIQLSSIKERKLMLPVGVLSGFINGVTGSQIMPIMPYLLSLKMDRDLFIQTINCAFTLNTIIMIIALGKIGLLTKPVAFLSAFGILPVVLGIFLGTSMRKKVTEEIFRKMVLIMLVVLGITLVVKPFL